MNYLIGFLIFLACIIAAPFAGLVFAATVILTGWQAACRVARS